MAHGIFNNANTSMAYSGETPWHGIGTQLPDGAAIGDILAAVDFYRVERREVFAAGMESAIPDRVALFTDGSREPARYLSTVSDGYGVVDFADLYSPIVSALHGKVEFKTAGLLGERGAAGWLLAKMPGALQVKGDRSEYVDYLLLTTSHDGTCSAKALGTSVRVVCQNTLNMALRGTASAGKTSAVGFSVRHTSNAKARVAGEYERLLARTMAEREQFGQLANAMAATRWTDTDSRALVNTMLPLPTAKDGEATPEVSTRLANQRERMLGLLTGGMVGPEITGTAWGAVQAMAEWADHRRKLNPSKALPAWTRLDDVLLGAGADLKRDALGAVLFIMGA